MANTMRVPTEFTAVDRFTSVISKMTAGVSSFVKAAGKGITGVNNAIDKSISKLGQIGQVLLGVSIGGLFGMAVQDIKDYGDALASFRVIVSDLSANEFKAFEKGIANVAKTTNKSTIEVAQSFERIAGLNADFAKTADGLANVSKQAIILSKASGDDLGTSAENLVGIMNQYSLGAERAAYVSNILAAGQAVGASSITQSSEAYKNFGSVAKSANITLEQSQGLIQTLGKYSLFGAEAGTKLRGVTLQLQKAGLGYASGQFKINDALLQVQKRLSKLGTEKRKDAYLTKIFGAENITAGKILSSNIDTFNKFTEGVTGTGAAEEQARIKTGTLTDVINRLKNSFTNLITTNENVGIGVTLVKDALAFLAGNMQTVLTVLVSLLGLYVTFKALMIATTIATTAHSIAIGIMAATMSGSSIAIAGNNIALQAWYVTSYIAQAATWLMSTALWAMAAAVIAATWPILAIIAAIIAVIYIFVYWDEIVDWFSKQFEKAMNFIGNTWDALTKWFSEFSFTEFFKDIGRAIVDFMLLPLRAVLKLASFLPGKVGNLAQGALDDINKFTGEMGVSLVGEDSLNKPERLESPQEVNQNIAYENRMKGGIDINLNDPGKNVNKVGTSGFISNDVRISSTQGAF